MSTSEMGSNGAPGPQSSPSLGPTWYHCVSTRILIYVGALDEYTSGVPSNLNLSREREVVVGKSPFLSSISVLCIISSRGLVAAKIAPHE